jgi:hypothetical protein
MAKILIKKSGNLEKELLLGAPGVDSVSLGRDGANDLVLLDPSVSRRHARIERKGDAYRIVDLDSGNGISHRGRRVPFLELYPGCEVEIGAYTIVYEGEEERLPQLVLIAGARSEGSSSSDQGRCARPRPRARARPRRAGDSRDRNPPRRCGRFAGR